MDENEMDKKVIKYKPLHDQVLVKVNPSEVVSEEMGITISAPTTEDRQECVEGIVLNAGASVHFATPGMGVVLPRHMCTSNPRYLIVKEKKILAIKDPFDS